MKLHEALKPIAPNRTIRLVDSKTGEKIASGAKHILTGSMHYLAYYADCEVVKHEHVKEFHFLPTLVLYIQIDEE